MADAGTGPTPTAVLADFVSGARFADLPDSTRHAARRALVNIVGCCIGAAHHEIVDKSAEALLPLAGRPTAALLGRTERCDMLTAATLNGLASAAYSFDDTHAQTILHPSGAVAAVLLALAEQQPITGEDFLLAFVLGVEVACRVSKAVSVSPAAGDMGWSQSGIAAGIGAAAAASRALNLDATRISWAIGIAALHASGFRAAHGTMSATIIFGNAARDGLQAALLAQRGIDGPAAPLEGRFGFLSLFATKPHLPHLTDSLGRRFEVEALAYKPYPCGVVIHPAIDAALQWVREHALRPDRIAHAQLHTHSSALALGFRRHPAGVLEAKVSLYHWTAAALTYGRAGIAEGQASAIEDASVCTLRDRIEAISDPALKAEAALLHVSMDDGSRQTIHVTQCRGSMGRPMSDDDLDEKFLGQASMHLADDQAARLLASCWRIDQLGAASQIARMASPGEPRIAA